MFIIKDIQLEKFSAHFKLRFVEHLLSLNRNSNLEQLLFITDEALGFKIESEDLVSKYVELYLNHLPLFEVKPLWLKFVLKNEDYSSEDKLSHIEKNIQQTT